MSNETTGYKIKVISGPNRGQCYYLGDESMIINKEYMVACKNGYYIVSSFNPKGILFNQELAMESIIQAGDQIVTESAGYQVLEVTAAKKPCLRMLGLLALIGALGFALAFFWPACKECLQERFECFLMHESPASGVESAGNQELFESSAETTTEECL